MALLDMFDFEMPHQYVIYDSYYVKYPTDALGPNGENCVSGLVHTVSTYFKFLLKRLPQNNTIFIHFYHMGGQSFSYIFYNSAVSSAQYQVGVDLTALGFTEEEWLWCSLKFVTHPDIGGYELKIEGITVASEWNINTQSSGGPGIGAVRIYGRWWFICNVIFTDETGTYYNDFFDTPHRLVRLYPDANGTYNQFTPLSGQNFENVDDFDEDTSYNEDNGIGTKDSFHFDSLPVIEGMSPEIVQVETVAKRIAGDIEMSIFTREDGADTNRSVSNHVLSSSYSRYVDKIIDASEEDATVLRINGLEIGYKREV